MWVGGSVGWGLPGPSVPHGSSCNGLLYTAPPVCAQVAAIKTAVETREGVALIRGPPGTGKTRTLVGLMSALAAQAGAAPVGPGGSRVMRILVCAPSNTATDEIALRLMDTRLPTGERLAVVRLGLREKVHPKVRQSIYIDTLVDARMGTRKEDLEELTTRIQVWGPEGPWVWPDEALSGQSFEWLQASCVRPRYMTSVVFSVGPGQLLNQLLGGWRAGSLGEEVVGPPHGADGRTNTGRRPTNGRSGRL